MSYTKNKPVKKQLCGLQSSLLSEITEVNIFGRGRIGKKKFINTDIGMFVESREGGLHYKEANEEEVKLIEIEIK